MEIMETLVSTYQTILKYFEKLIRILSAGLALEHTNINDPLRTETTWVQEVFC